ncbi:hypothetical protein RRG08_031080 [Elysia crispata]|uniref:Reverse transcriptase n=1 Tax=Elysia crispata TaxID=231223 RepID=A0AAE0ZFC6_9GAST|nr:hypothetical protein RRG08_031080 [Elysia crispata]
MFTRESRERFHASFGGAFSRDTQRGYFKRARGRVSTRHFEESFLLRLRVVRAQGRFHALGKGALSRFEGRGDKQRGYLKRGRRTSKGSLVNIDSKTRKIRTTKFDVGDISTWQSDKDVDRATEALNRDLHALKLYCDQWGMQINTTKTVYNIYSNSREVLARDLELKIKDKRLQRDPLPRYLGVALDPRLNLTAHVEQLACRVRERIGLMKKLAGTNWGAALSSLKTLYVTFIRSALEYANPILNLASKTSLGKLDRIQNAAMRLMTGGLRSTPITALEVATGCEPLETRQRCKR